MSAQESSKHATNSDSPPGSRSASGPPGIRLSPRWLTISLIAVTLVPVALAGTVWFAVPAAPEPELAVEVSLQPVPWPPVQNAPVAAPSSGAQTQNTASTPAPAGTDNETPVRLMPGVRIRNGTADTLKNVSMGINKQFYFYCPEPIGPNAEFSVPLTFFRTSGNQPYRPGVVKMRLLTVYAQLPTGKRAVKDIKY